MNRLSLIDGSSCRFACAVGPRALLLENLQWLDSLSLDVLSFMVCLHTERLPLLMVRCAFTCAVVAPYTSRVRAGPYVAAHGPADGALARVVGPPARVVAQAGAARACAPC